jgi:prefoldin subunit 5
MNAYELADIVDKWAYKESAEYLTDAATLIRQQQAEIEALKEQLEDCTCQGGHSEAYLKAKGKLK